MIGSKHLSNSSAIVIDKIDYDIDDMVVFHYDYGNTKSKKIKAKIKYTNKGAYFTSKGERHYLNDFMRTNY